MRKVQPLFIKEGNEGFLFTFMITLGISDVKYKTADAITVPAVLRLRNILILLVANKFIISFYVFLPIKILFHIIAPVYILNPCQGQIYR